MAGLYSGGHARSGGIYSNGHASSGGIYSGGGKNAAKKSGGGTFGFLHHGPIGFVSHLASKTADDLYRTAVQTPGGLYQLGKGTVHDVESAAHGDLSFKNTRHTAVEMGKATLADLEHPLRHPGNTLLDVLAVGSLGVGTAARLGAAGRVAAGSARAGEILRPVAGTRTLRAGGFEAEVGNSRAALTRFTQKHINDLRNRFPDKHILGRDQFTRVGRELGRKRQFEQKLFTIPFHQLRHEGRKVKWNSPEGVAMRAVAEGTSLDDRIALHKADLLKAKKPSVVRALKAQIAVAENAKALVHVHPGGHLTLRDPKLAALFEKTKAAALLEDQRLAETGALPADVAANAIQKPGKIVKGDLGADHTAGQFHVGYERRNKPFSVNRPATVGSANTIGIPRVPGRLNHALTGTNLHEGAFRNDVPTIVAENALESERHAALLRERDRLIERAHDTPEGIAHPVAIRLDELKNEPFPPPVKDIQDVYRQGRQLGKKQTSLLGLTYDKVREEVFPNIQPEDVGAHEGVKWIDERLLGGLNKPNPLATVTQYKSGRAVLKVVDAVNNAQRAADLYLKPAYAAPNLLGNAALTIIQQGFAAPRNLKDAALLSHRLSPELAVKVDHLMGEGTAVAVAGDSGLGTKGIQALAGGWGKVVDLPFRRSAFLHEARKAGVGSPDKLKALLTDEAHSETLYHLTAKAVGDVIDYNRLGPFERSIIRRVIFFYPWVKGSTVYAGRFIAEHPLQAAFSAALGTEGQKISDQKLGAVPSWWQGIIPVGNGRIVNPAAATLFGSAAAGPEVLKGLITGHPAQAFQGSQYATPFVQEALKGDLGAAAKDYVTATPQFTLGKRLLRPGYSKLSPMSRRDALLQFMLSGTFAPRTVNLGQLHKDAALEKKPKRY